MNLNSEETLINMLSKLYRGYGYKKYKPECFEDYSLFLENRDFLICKNVITFADSGGKLLALRPDVTISVIKHITVPFGECEKLFYTEKVYRQSADGGDFKEINQTGVEVVGQIDGLRQAEISVLALKTLSLISADSLLCLSHMAYTEGLFDWFNARGEDRNRLYALLKSKNFHDFLTFAKDLDLSGEQINAFNFLCCDYEDGGGFIKNLKNFAKNEKMARAQAELYELCSVLNGLGYKDKYKVDFSVLNDENYYDGLIFEGYVNGIPRAVLSGGRYDKLVKKLHKTQGAIGFGLYMGELERYYRSPVEKTDKVIYYGNDILSALREAENKISAGMRVRLVSESNINAAKNGGGAND